MRLTPMRSIRRTAPAATATATATAAAAPAAWWQRCVLALLALGLALQGLALAVGRAHGPAHFHLDPPIAAHANPLDGHRYLPELAYENSGGPNRGHQADADHHQIAHHDHAAGQYATDGVVAAVVAVAEDDAASALNPPAQLPHSALDADGVLRVAAVAAAADRTRWPDTHTRRYRSQIRSPPGRPPRA